MTTRARYLKERNGINELNENMLWVVLPSRGSCGAQKKSARACNSEKLPLWNWWIEDENITKCFFLFFIFFLHFVYKNHSAIRPQFHVWIIMYWADGVFHFVFLLFILILPRFISIRLAWLFLVVDCMHILWLPCLIKHDFYQVYLYFNKRME